MIPYFLTIGHVLTANHVPNANDYNQISPRAHRYLWQDMGVTDDSFELYDLRIDWIEGDHCFCQAGPGDHFFLYGEQLHFPAGQTWSIYTLAALLPLLPAKQRPTHPHDWMTTDGLVACPDPNCTSRFRISRCGTRKFRHSEVTAVPLNSQEPEDAS